MYTCTCIWLAPLDRCGMSWLTPLGTCIATWLPVDSVVSGVYLVTCRHCGKWYGSLHVPLSPSTSSISTPMPLAIHTVLGDLGMGMGLNSYTQKPGI